MTKTDPITSQSMAIAKTFVKARQQGRALTDFPDTLPGSLDEAYAIQNAAIAIEARPVLGWKVGRIPPAFETDLGCDRLAGPIFSVQWRETEAQPPEMPVFVGGFAAVEAEFVAVIGQDAPKEKTQWSLDETADIISSMHIGLEIASSPLPTINELGPLAVVSDFGNNHGLIVGPEIGRWRERALDSLQCTTFVEDLPVGSGGAFTLDGGYLRSVQFLLELSATRRMPLRKGQVIATGQTNGIHDVIPGQSASIEFAGDGRIGCTIVAVSH